MHLRPLSLLAAVLALTSSPLAFGEDWPRFLGPNGDNISTEKIADAWPAKLTAAWSLHVGIGYSSPVAVGGKAYMFAMDKNKDVLSAIDIATGKVLWQDSTGSPWTKGGLGHPGTRATPTIEGDFIYTYSGRGDLVCRNLADGKPVWNINVLKDTNAKDLEWGASSSPAIYGDVIYVQSGKGGPVAVAVNKKTGQYVWKSDNALGGYATPILIKVGDVEQIIAFGGDAVHGLNAKNGKSLWSVPWKTSYDVNAATPIYRDGKLFVSSGYNHGCMMLDVTADGAKVAWEAKAIQAQFPTPILDGDLLFGNSAGTIVCMKWPTKETAWRAEDPSLRIGNGGSMLRVGDKLITLSERGKVSLVRATDKGIEKLSQFDAVDGQKIWSSPVLHNGKLLIKGAEELVCFDVPTK